MGQFQSLREVVAALRRRFWLIAAIIALGAVLSLNAALTQPRYYEATAVIQIESPMIVSDPARAQVAPDAAHRLQLIQQRLMSRDNLIDVIDRNRLFADRPDMPISEKVYQLRIATRITQISEGTQSWQPGGTTPSGLSVTVRLGDAEKAAAVANQFVESVMAQNLQRRSSLARETLEFYAAEEARISASIETLERTLASFKRENAEALPENVTALRTQLASLQETELEIDRQLIALESGTARQRQTVQDRQAGLLRDQKALVTRRIADIEALIDDAPRVERQYNTLTRELRQLQDRLSAVTMRRSEAEMSQLLESRQQTERFEILETALVPEIPVSPSRKKVALLGLAVSVVVAFGTAFLIEIMNPAIRSAAQLERALDISPVVSIPVIRTRHERLRRLVTLIGAGAALLIGLPLILRLLADRFGSLRFLGGN